MMISYVLRYRDCNSDSDFYEQIISLVIRQKGESQNGCLKKTKHAKVSEKRTFLTPWYAHVCVSGGKKCSFFEKFGVLCFLETPVFRFALLPYYRWYLVWKWITHSYSNYSQKESPSFNLTCTVVLLV